MTTSVEKLPHGDIEYRLTGVGEGVILAFHGSHLSAASDVGIGDLVHEKRRVLIVSRPGYGRTPLGSGPRREIFADHVAQLASALKITHFDAVVGMSAGGATAVAFAARYPWLTGSLILQSALSSEPYGVTSFAPSIAAFSPMSECLTWATLRAQLTLFPDLTLNTIIGSLATVPGHQVRADFSPGETRLVMDMLREMRSGSGFLLDMTEPVKATAELAVRAPTLVIASPYDGQVPIEHSHHLASVIPGATFYESSSRSHLVWFGSGVPGMRDQIHRLLSGTKRPTKNEQDSKEATAGDLQPG